MFSVFAIPAHFVRLPLARDAVLAFSVALVSFSTLHSVLQVLSAAHGRHWRRDPLLLRPRGQDERLVRADADAITWHHEPDAAHGRAHGRGLACVVRLFCGRRAAVLVRSAVLVYAVEREADTKGTCFRGQGVQIPLAAKLRVRGSMSPSQGGQCLGAGTEHVSGMDCILLSGRLEQEYDVEPYSARSWS